MEGEATWPSVYDPWVIIAENRGGITAHLDLRMEIMTCLTAPTSTLQPKIASVWGIR
jgi:hypothetical protein